MENSIKTPWHKYYDEAKINMEYPDISVYEMLKRSVKKHPQYISYNYFGCKKNYQQFLNQVDECAKSLKYLGIKERDKVSICMPNTPEALISFYAINKIGAVANMIHPLSSENEIKHFFNISKSKCLITIDIAFNKINHIVKDTSIEKAIIVSAKNSMPTYLRVGYELTQGRKIKIEKSDIALKWNDFVKLGRNYNQNVECDYRGKEVAAILYSGGTTGEPKGIELTNLNFNSLAMECFEACNCLKEEDLALSIMPIFHGFGLGICIHAVQCFGGTSIILPKFSSKTFDKLLKKYKPNIIAGVPTLYEALLKNKKLNGYDLSFLRCVISGGDSLSLSLKKKIDEFLKEHGSSAQIREGYGLTECVTGCCMMPENCYKEGSIGIPYPGIYIKIVKKGTEEELPYGEDGEIVISGPTVMKGYLEDEEETKKALKKHKDGLVWLHTGDLGHMDEDGFIYFKQRIKRVIVSSGYSIYPQHIENIIDSNPNVLMSCVIGIPDEYKGQKIKAFIVLKNGIESNESTLKEIREYCESKLAKYSWIAEYEFRDELPKTLVGKIAYTKLEEEERAKNESK